MIPLDGYRYHQGVYLVIEAPSQTFNSVNVDYIEKDTINRHPRLYQQAQNAELNQRPVTSDPNPHQQVQNAKPIQLPKGAVNSDSIIAHQQVQNAELGQHPKSAVTSDPNPDQQVQNAKPIQLQNGSVTSDQHLKGTVNSDPPVHLQVRHSTYRPVQKATSAPVKHSTSEQVQKTESDQHLKNPVISDQHLKGAVSAGHSAYQLYKQESKLRQRVVTSAPPGHLTRQQLLRFVSCPLFSRAGNRLRF